jgi:hypothetical protein
MDDDDLIFADGFESGDLCAWSSSGTDGGDLSVTAAAAIGGSFGLAASRLAAFTLGEGSVTERWTAGGRRFSSAAQRLKA